MVSKPTGLYAGIGRRIFAVLAFAALMQAGAGMAGKSHMSMAGIVTGQYWGCLLSDSARIVRAPLAWGLRDWGKAAAIGGAVAALHTQDIRLRKVVIESRSPATVRAANLVEKFGNGVYLLPALAASAAGSWLAGERGLERASLQAMENVLVAGGILNGAAKVMSQRDRPFTGDGPQAWEGPGLAMSSSSMSFPSGHACAAFAAATAFAGEFRERWWVAPVAYGIAGTTALSRMHDDAHWASDVLCGAALGYFTGSALGKWRRETGADDGPKLAFLAGRGRVLLRFDAVLL